MEARWQRVQQTAILMVLAACTADADPEMPAGFDAASGRVIQAVWRAVGEGAAAGVTDIATDATVTSSAGEFTTTIYADRSGRARMKQNSGFDAIIDTVAAWAVDAEGHWTEADPETHALVRGHELHMLALDPRHMFASARLMSPTTFAEVDCLAISFLDPAGREVVAYYAAADTMPVGARAVWAEPDVVITFDDWETVDGLRTFRRARFRQGAETFDYHFTSIRFNTLPADSLVAR